MVQADQNMDENSILVEKFENDMVHSSNLSLVWSDNISNNSIIFNETVSKNRNYNDTVCPISTLEEEYLMGTISFWLEGVAQSIICILGSTGNAMCIFLLSRKDLCNSFNQLLATLATFDLIYLATMALQALRQLGMEVRLHLYIFPYFLYPLNSISLTGSIYMTMAITIERYIAVYHPLDYNRIMTDASTHKRRLFGYLVPVTLVSVVFNIPKFLESQIIWNEDEPMLGLTDLRTSENYIMYYHNWARLVVLGVIPISVIAILNMQIYRAVRRRKGGRKRHDEHLSLILMMIVLIFVLCNLPRLLLNTHELSVLHLIKLCEDTALMGFPVWSVILGFVSQVLLCINSSANLLIYCCLGTKFREVAQRYFCRLNSGKAECRCLHSTEGGKCRNCGIQRIGLETIRNSNGNQPNILYNQEPEEYPAFVEPETAVINCTHQDRDTSMSTLQSQLSRVSSVKVLLGSETEAEKWQPSAKWAMQPSDKIALQPQDRLTPQQQQPETITSLSLNMSTTTNKDMITSV